MHVLSFLCTHVITVCTSLAGYLCSVCRVFVESTSNQDEPPLYRACRPTFCKLPEYPAEQPVRGISHGGINFAMVACMHAYMHSTTTHPPDQSSFLTSAAANSSPLDPGLSRQEQGVHGLYPSGTFASHATRSKPRSGYHHRILACQSLATSLYLIPRLLDGM
jgi:hypothetical protein